MMLGEKIKKRNFFITLELINSTASFSSEIRSRESRFFKYECLQIVRARIELTPDLRNIHIVRARTEPVPEFRKVSILGQAEQQQPIMPPVLVFFFFFK